MPDDEQPAQGKGKQPPQENKSLEDRIKSIEGFSVQQIADLLTIFRLQRTAVHKDVTKIVQGGEEEFKKGLTEAKQCYEKAIELRQQQDPSLRQTFDNAKDMASVVIQKAVAAAAKDEIDKGKDEIRKYALEQKSEAVLEAKQEIRDILKGQILKGFKKSRNYIIAAGIAAVLGSAVASGISVYNSWQTRAIDVKGARDEIKKQNAIIDRIGEEKDELKKENTALKKRVGEGESGLASLAGVVNVIEEQIYGSKDKKDKTPGLVQRVAKLDEDSSKIGAEVYGTKDKRGLTGRVGEVETRNEEDKKGITGLEGRVEGTEGKITAVEGRVGGQEQIAKGLEKRIGLLEDSSKKYAIHMRALDELRKSYETDNDFVKALPYIKDRLAELEPEIKKASLELYGDKEIEGLKGKNEKIGGILEKMRIDYTNLKNAYDGLKARVERVEGEPKTNGR